MTTAGDANIRVIEPEKRYMQKYVLTLDPSLAKVTVSDTPPRPIHRNAEANREFVTTLGIRFYLAIRQISTGFVHHR